jgi:hypothetical protein
MSLIKAQYEAAAKMLAAADYQGQAAVELIEAAAEMMDQATADMIEATEGLAEGLDILA